MNYCLNLTAIRYLKGALVPDSDGEVGTAEAPTGRRRDYVPSADPGSRLPHMNVRVLSTLTSGVCNLVISKSCIGLYILLALHVLIL